MDNNIKKIYLADLHLGNGGDTDYFHFDNEFEELINNAIEDNVSEIIIVGDLLELMMNDKIDEVTFSLNFSQACKNIDLSIIDNITKTHQKVFDAFKKFSRKGKIKYIIGNHDVHLIYNDKLMEKTAQALSENEENIDVLPYYIDNDFKVFSIHGNQFDIPNKIVERKNGKDILPPFSDYMYSFMKRTFEKKLENLNIPVAILQNVHLISPILDIFEYLKFIQRKHDVNEDLSKVWTDNFIKLLNSEYGNEWVSVIWPKLKLLKKIFINEFGGMTLGQFMVTVVMHIRKVRKTDNLFRQGQKILGVYNSSKGFKEVIDVISNYWKLEEDIPILPTELKGVIMGHNHRHCVRIIPKPEEYVFYANTGAWTPVIEKIQSKGLNGFEKRIEMAYIELVRNGQDIRIISNNLRKYGNNHVMELSY